MIRVFIVVTILSVVSILALVVIENTTDAIGCKQEQGAGKIIILAI